MFVHGRDPGIGLVPRARLSIPGDLPEWWVDFLQLHVTCTPLRVHLRDVLPSLLGWKQDRHRISKGVETRMGKGGVPG